jgi:hypothetical protein
MTKNIEGTVDDDVAAKLAVGEGRQADLEQVCFTVLCVSFDVITAVGSSAAAAITLCCCYFGR